MATIPGGPFQSFPRPCKPSEHPMCWEDLCVCLLHFKVLRRPPVSACYTGRSWEDLLCLPDTLEGPEKTSCVCLLHWKVLRPPVSAWYTGRSWEDLLCLPATLEGPEKTSCVCLIHWKVRRRPPVSAWYTGRSWEDLLWLPDTLEGPEKTSCVCLLHFKVLRRPPVSAWYTGRSWEDLLCLPVTLEGPYKGKGDAGLSKSGTMTLKVEEGWRWRSDRSPKRLGGKKWILPYSPKKKHSPTHILTCFGLLTSRTAR